MARIRSVDFLPEIFQTSTTKKFLNSTLDQLIQEPKLKQTQGYIGRTNAPSKSPTDGYIDEPTVTRTNYQLEPGVIFNDVNGNVTDALTYIGLIDGLKTAGANVDNHDRLFSSEAYSWSPYIEFDKIVNYSQYFWLPAGPNSVNVSAINVLLSDDFNVTPNADSISIEGLPQTNPVLTLLRGGTYNFNVSQAGQDFWIQTHPGTDGTVPWASNISSREILGVTNNGDDDGTINFVVPAADAQIAFHNFTDIGTVDIATDERMDSIADLTLATVQSTFPIQTDLESKTIIFLRDDNLGWVNDGNPVVTDAERYQVYRIDIEDVAGTDYVRLVPLQLINVGEQFTILYGTQYANVVFYKDADEHFERVPTETASLDTLYYQDASDPNLFGTINIIDLTSEASINVTNIIGRKTYTSPNGVVFTNGLKVRFTGDVLPVEFADNEYYVEGVGTAIKLVLVSDLIVPEPYAVGEPEPWDINPWDSSEWAATSSTPADQDYLTINRSSRDKNAWSRSNRWFHFDVLVATANYNSVTLELDNVQRAKRPIIEFDADLRLFNYGIIGKHTVHVIDFDNTDALSTVNGAIYESPTSSTGDPEAFIDGYKLGNGSRVIFAGDLDPTVRNVIYEVELIDINNDNTLRINLVPIVDGTSDVNDIIIIAKGTERQGTVYAFDGETWVVSQAKTGVNQPPLFDIFDIAGYSLSDELIYNDTTFAGSKIFSYAPGTGAIDTILGFSLQYLNIDNLGDIVFENNLYTDTFEYTVDTVLVPDTSITIGFVRKYSSYTEFTNNTGWVTSAESTHQAQVFDTVYTGDPITLDITPSASLSVPSVKISATGAFVTPENYTITSNVITFGTQTEIGTELNIRVISDEISETGYYEIPANLESNMFNENTSLLTLGTIRNHYNRLSENIFDLVGPVNGANNLRDLGEISKYGTLIVQQSSPLALTAMFLRNKEYNFFNSIEFAAKQYEKFKNRIINWVEENELGTMTVPQILDAAIKEINTGKTTASAFYWSDMLPSGLDYESTAHVITAISTQTVTTLNTYDFTTANTKALMVYHNNVLLTKDVDYTVATDGPRITLAVIPPTGDIITVNEYSSTLGTAVPSTPTKLGMYPKFVPLKFTDDTYVTPVDVIQGHDGSITVAHGDLRDDVLLEFENRIYNNLKVTETLPIEPADIVPGVFRQTEYTIDEVTQITATSVLSWLGWNRIDYKSQEYNATDEKTWNYSTATNKITGEKFQQANWRGIYNYFYDTDSPHIRPWEMVGLTKRPDWWNTSYGTAPYTSGNLVLWDDMEAGLIKEPGNERVDTRYVRPGLTSILPVDSAGNLVMPLTSVVSTSTSNDFKRSWTIGDNAPAESAWRKSSAWPFAVQRLYALTKPAQFFALMADRDRYAFSPTVQQYLYDERLRLDTRTIELSSESQVKHSYINWILDYNRYHGYNSEAALATSLSNLDVNLCHHMASFTDKNNLKIFTDKSSPDSTSSSLLLPDESFTLLLYKNQPQDEIIYSSVIVQRVDGGYSVTGNSTTDPYFRIQTAVSTGKYKAISVGAGSNATTVAVPLEFTDAFELVPYSQVFSSKQGVSEFLISYGEYLTRAGLQFNTVEATQVVNWGEMVQEFIYWSDQGWAIDSIINLNPSATEIEFERALHIVDDLNNLELTEQPQNQNREPLDISDYVVDRIDNNFKIRMVDNNIISYLKFNLTSFEHLLVLDNISIFNDLIYDPVTGIRQQRVNLSGFTTFEWNGQVDAQGFLINEDNVKAWAPVSSYNKGDIVNFKNAYWSATEKVQPSNTFDFSQWIKTDYDSINKGLLPNLATKSDQMLEYYNNKTANLETDIDLMAYGLTGFRSRDYLLALDLDDISQVNIYSNLIETKGTPKSLTLFKDVTLNNETVDYSIFENWAIKRAEYGATSTRAYIDLQLDDQQLTSNPSLVEIVDVTNSTSKSDMLINLDDIYKQSVKHLSTSVFTTLNETNYDTALPTAGFVQDDDVDIAVFEISEIDSTVTVVDGSIIWVAKDTEVDWNVYHATKIDAVIVTIEDNLDGTLTLVTDIPHNLLLDTTINVSNTDAQATGTYKVLSVPDVLEVVIKGALANNQTCVLDQTGTLLEFISARVEVPSSIVGTIFDSNLSATDTVWVNNDNSKTAVYKKTSPFTLADSEINPKDTSTRFGYSVAQGYNDSGMLVGDPASDSGVVHLYSKANDVYTFVQTLLPSSSLPVLQYGSAVTLIETWGAIAATGTTAGATADATLPTADSLVLANAVPAPGSVEIINRDATLNTITQTQTLVSPNYTVDVEDSFGASIAMSKDEEWLFVGEPLNNEVHTYQNVSGTFVFVSTIDYNTANNGVAFTSGDDFGAAIDVSTDARHIVIAAPAIEKAFIINRVVERFVITDASTLAYTTLRTPLGTVLNNGVALDASEFTIAGNVVTIVTGTAEAGDSLEVDIAEFKLIQDLAVPGMSATNSLAICKTKCSLYVGADGDLSGQGTVSRFENKSRTYGTLTSTVANPLIPANSTIRINNVDVALPFEGTSLLVADAINAAAIPNIDASEANGLLTIQLTNKIVRLNPNRLDILAGANISLVTLGFTPYAIAQTITSPVTTTVAQHFGNSLALDLSLDQLAVGTPDGIGDNISTSADTTSSTADNGLITTDASGNTGVVYTYDLMSGSDITSDMLLLGQEILDTDMYTGDAFGSAVSLIDGVLVVSAMNYDLNTATTSGVTADQTFTTADEDDVLASGGRPNIGRVVIFNNTANTLSWIASNTQNDQVDVTLINAVYMYNNDSLSVIRDLDYIDPLNGKILGAASQNIDFITPYDPTVYDNASAGLLWSADQVGKMWWDIKNVRFRDYTTGTAHQTSKVWGRTFTGSTVDIYQWTESTALPANYAGTGTILAEDKYVTVSTIDRSGLLQNVYYYWVRNVETISVNSEKTLSAAAVASYIEAPKSSGISFLAFVAPNLIGIYNCKDIINNTDTIIHIEYSKIKNENNVFVEYDLFRENHPNDFLSDGLYKKLQDSLVGIDTDGNIVPATGLTSAERYGVEFRPRQTMFIDRYAAIASYLKKVNGILASNTITESRAYPMLESEEAIPTASTGAWDLQVASTTELSFQDFTAVGTGFKYLVTTDDNNSGRWAIYEVTASLTFETLLQIDVQEYDTTQYWSTVNWYKEGFDPFSRIDFVVTEFTELATLGIIENNAVAKVTFNSVGSWELYQYIDGAWVRTALENGTIQLDERLWTTISTPVTELRNVIRSINEELLISDLATDRSRTMLSIFNYVLGEQPNVDWLIKTSLIDVTQKVRSLSQYAVYQKDNQDYLTQYLGEAKPYHTKIKDFSLSYDGFDLIAGTVTDFDCPSTFSTEFDQYISPILDDGAVLVSDPSNKPADDIVWQTPPWSEWYDNYKLTVKSVVVTNPGTGYTIAPEVVVTGASTSPAVMTALLGPGGIISEIVVVTPGSGYLTPPTISFTGSTGVDAAATAIMENALVRTFKVTAKYDRYEYVSKVAQYEENTVTSTRNLVFKYSGPKDIVQYDPTAVDPQLLELIIGAEYKIAAPGNTNFLAAGATSSNAGTTFTATASISNANPEPTGSVIELPKLFRVTTLYTDTDDNTVFDPTKFEEVAYITSEDGTRSYVTPTADTIILTADGSTEIVAGTAASDIFTADSIVLTADVDSISAISSIHSITADSAYGLDAIEIKYLKEGIASWYELDGVIVNENNNSESRNFVRYNNKVYNMITFEDTTTFLSTKYVEIELETLSGIDRTTGFYVSDVNRPGLDLSLLFNGISFPGVQVDGDTFSVTESELDTIYESQFLDTYLGTRPEDINVDGGAFVDEFHSHAPEELVPGAIYDTLDIKVFARPGSDYLTDGHAFALSSFSYTVNASTESFSFADAVPHPITVIVANITTGLTLYETLDFTVDWADQEIDIISGITAGDDIKIIVYEVGGGNQLYRNSLRGSDTTANAFTVDVRSTEINKALVFVNGVEDAGVTITAVDDQTSTLTLSAAPSPTDFITVTIFGISTGGFEESYPLVELWTGDLTVDPGTSVTGKSRHNAIVEVNGSRLRPPSAARTTADGVTTNFLYPLNGGYSGDAVADNEVDVYVNDTLLASGIDYVTGPLGVDRYVILGTAPAAGDTVEVYVRTSSEYWYSGTEILFTNTYTGSDQIAVTTFRDLRELDILTQVYQGPTIASVEELNAFDSASFDTEDFDFVIGANASVNVFTLDRDIIIAQDRLWVTLNGNRIHPGTGFSIINDNQLVIAGPTISVTDVVVVTSITENVITAGSTFRLFKDMRDTVGMYKMASTTSTYLTQDLSLSDDIIYVADASVLGTPDLTAAKFGIIIINGERITYREQDLLANTVSGLRRGTAGTGATAHLAGDIVGDVSLKGRVPWNYDQIWYASGAITASNGVPLQDQSTVPALFIKP